MEEGRKWCGHPSDMAVFAANPGICGRTWRKRGEEKRHICLTPRHAEPTLDTLCQCDCGETRNTLVPSKGPDRVETGGEYRLDWNYRRAGCNDD